MEAVKEDMKIAGVWGEDAGLDGGSWLAAATPKDIIRKEKKFMPFLKLWCLLQSEAL